ncbi:hypothetical protein [Rhizobium sp. H4]|uniref:hypothetical protein n=1 Tax=Rhizobium sp. H4 TaxID=2035449 RepID=UPI001FE18F16|nr:hypothetical protein [Rhizobium sp. H4]
MSFRPFTGGVLGAVFVSVSVLTVALLPDLSLGEPLIVKAQAQSNQQNPLERVQSAVENLIARLRGREMPEGVVK